jgi:hypothetical protein
VQLVMWDLLLCAGGVVQWSDVHLMMYNLILCSDCAMYHWHTVDCCAISDLGPGVLCRGFGLLRIDVQLVLMWDLIMHNWCRSAECRMTKRRMTKHRMAEDRMTESRK